MSEYPKRNAFATASLIAGILSIVSILTAILPFPLGALGILFAILSYRKGQELPSASKTGLITSIIGLSLGVVIMIAVINTLPTVLRDPMYRAYLNNMCKSTYGVTFDEMVEKDTGIDLNKYFPIEDSDTPPTLEQTDPETESDDATTDDTASPSE